jgi:hypothetical protein
MSPRFNHLALLDLQALLHHCSHIQCPPELGGSSIRNEKKITALNVLGDKGYPPPPLLSTIEAEHTLLFFLLFIHLANNPRILCNSKRSRSTILDIGFYLIGFEVQHWGVQL